jgi:uncharacterized protein YidB (DUF937 family)
MGLFDDAVPGGSIAKPLMIALGALVIGKMMSGGSAPAPQAAPAPPAPPQPAPGGGFFGGLAGGGLAGGGLAGGLGGLLSQLSNAGHGEAASSWVGPGQNAPIQPTQLGSALGQTTVSELAQHAGISEQELLSQLSQVLPGVVDKLTPDGRIPTQAELLARWNQG